MVRRLFVEKKQGFDIEAATLLLDLKESLGLNPKSELRLFNRYDIEGLETDEYERSKYTIFSEPNVDDVFENTLPLDSSYTFFTTEYLPGQYDQRADSAAQCVQLQTGKNRPAVATAKVIAIKGSLSPEMLLKIEDFIVNPVEARLTNGEMPESLSMTSEIPADIVRINGFIKMTDQEVTAYHKEMEFAMTAADLCFCRDYFISENRDPSLTELKVIDTYWSDHCRHTTFMSVLENIEIEPSPLTVSIETALTAYFEARKEVYGSRDKAVSLMDIATMGMRLLKKRGLIPDLDESEEINACSIEAPIEIDGKTETWLIQFKNETHNHPTEIEPFGGAATCLGGAIRDPLSGRSYVYQAMRVTGCGDPTVPFSETLASKLPQKKITVGAAHGYSSYGNQIGLSTGQVAELYDSGYVAKRMEIGAVIGASPKENVVREVPNTGDVIVLLGGRTGRDGCGGATGSSKAHDSNSVEACGAQVQKGNPPTERKIQRLFRNPAVSKMIKRCNDFGAGGVCVAIGELADSLLINLDNVPKKYDGLDGTELAISESQERMAVVLKKEDVDTFIALSAEENLEAIAVAVVTDNNRLKMNWRGDEIVDLSRDFLNTNGVTGKVNVKITAPSGSDYRNEVPQILKGMSVDEAFVANLSRLEVASQKGLSERFDSSIGAGTVLMPFGGSYQLTPEEAMVAKVPVLTGSTDTATAMSYGFIPAVTSESPFHGSAFAVMESLSKLAAVGADPLTARLTFQEYFERLYDKSERWGKPTAALLGAFMAQIEMGTPSIGGKDSMSGSFNELDVPPTLVSFAVALTKASQTVSAAFKKAKSNIILIPLPVDNKTRLPDFARAKELYKQIFKLSSAGKILSAGVVKEGGVAASIAKMAFGNQIGVHFMCRNFDKLFAPMSGSFIIETDNVADFDGFQLMLIGETTADKYFDFTTVKVPMEKALEAFCGKLEHVFPTTVSEKINMQNIPLYTEKSGIKPLISVAKPHVLIPVFPGTNCEYDTARAFEKAGAIAEILVVKNLSANDILETIDNLVKQIEKSQIIMLPGGFSGGDEPDGSGKFIATTFRNARVKEAVTKLLYERDGLMLGICNGFQALIKLGLVPFGEILDQKESYPTLTFNTIGRHVSQMAFTKVVSTKSPWLSLCNAGDLHTIPISHGEGRFVANDETLKQLIANGQIATQYVGLDGNPTTEMPWNPNGSVCSIEGITSLDGRVFGKMGHSERKSDSCYKNVPGNKDQLIFEAGVKYYK